MTLIGSMIYSNTRAGASAFLLGEKTSNSLAWYRPYNHAAFFSSSRRRGAKGRLGSRSEKRRLFPEEINIIYDSKCNVCKLEINFLRKRDLKLAQKRNNNNEQLPPQPRLKFTDLEHGDYNPKDPANGGVTYERGMKSMHAITADGKVVDGVPVFSMAYQQVNLGWLFAVAEIAWVKRIADYGYNMFAKYRTNITRGQSVDSLVQAYQEKKVLEEQKQQKLGDCDACTQKSAK